MYITAIFTDSVLKKVKNKNLRYAIKATVVFGARQPGLSKRNFCNGLEMKLSAPLGGIQQAGAQETDVKALLPGLPMRFFEKLPTDTSKYHRFKQKTPGRHKIR